MNIVCVSNWLNNEVKKSFLHNYPTYTINNYVDLKKFDILPLKEYQIKKNNNTIILLGVASVWSKAKGINELMDLSLKLPINMKLVLIGSMSRKLKKQCIKVGIKLIGKVNDYKELVQYYNIADYVISLSKEETFGMTIAEGQACGTPSIILCNTGIKELVDDQTGISIVSYNADSIISKIKFFEKEKRAIAQSNCRKYALEHYSSVKQCSKYINLYKELSDNDK